MTGSDFKSSSLIQQRGIRYTQTLYEIITPTMKNDQLHINRPKSQTEVDQIILQFLGDFKIIAPQDLVALKDRVLNYLESRPYTSETKQHADSIQWKRTASQILLDKYVYAGKACSDISVVFLALCKAAGIEGQLVKLRSMDRNSTHSIVEVQLNDTWYRIDPSSRDSAPFEGQLNHESIWNKKFTVWKKGRDVWSLDLFHKDDEKEIGTED